MIALKRSSVRVLVAVVMAGLLGGTIFTTRLAQVAQGGAEKTTDENTLVQSMFYKARSPRTGNMWDTWMVFHEGTYYLYYLGISGDDLWDNVSMAVSPDGVHWKEIGPVFSMDPKAMCMGSGSTWKSPNFEKDGKFFTHFVVTFPGYDTAEGKLDLTSRLKNGFPPKTILFAESTDLIHWKRLERAKYGFVPDSRWYEPGGAWDCISAIPRPGGGMFGYWTATPKAETGGTVGFGQSLDGVRWEALPPPKTPGVVRGEIGGVEKIGQKFYMMQGHNFVMRTLIADQPQGPFLPAKKNFRLLSGHTYFTRFLRTPDGLLVNHHASSFKPAPGFGRRQVYFSPLKSAVVDDEGVLRLGWWKGNEKMKHEPIEVKFPDVAPGEPATIAMLGNTFDTQGGILLEGTLSLPKNADSPRRGLYIECADGRGSAVLLDARGVAELGSIRIDGSKFKAEKRVDREMTFGRPAAFRLLLKESLLEFYLDDILIECFSLPADATGRIGLIRGSCSRAIGKLEAWSATAAPTKTILGAERKAQIEADWAKQDGLRGAVPLELVLQRGRKLVAMAKRTGTPAADKVAALKAVEEEARRLPDDVDRGTPAYRELYLKARWAVRRLALSNPLLEDVDAVLFTKRAPPRYPHMCDQYYGWWAMGGGQLCVLEGFREDRPHVRSLTSDWPDGTFLRPDLSHDGKKVLFAYNRYIQAVGGINHPVHLGGMEKVDKDALPEESFFHVFEMDLATGQARQLTHGRYDDFDARYLPDGRIVFLSTRKSTSLQVGRASAQASLKRTLPDSYVRCGGTQHRPVSIYTLHAMDADGGDMEAISAFESSEWTPSVHHDGQVLYARWDYIDRNNQAYMSLWSTHPDGTQAQLVYGNYTQSPLSIFEARPVPGSRKLVFTASSHHAHTGGTLCLLDPAVGKEGEEPLMRLTPEVGYPESEGWPNHFYAHPWPLSEDFFLVSWSDRQLQKPGTAALGIYLYDAAGNLELLYRDPAIGCRSPIPLRARPRPPVVADLTPDDGPPDDGPPLGRAFVQDVYQGLDGIPRGQVKRLRVVALVPKVQPEPNEPFLGHNGEDPGKFVLGSVPVEPDGSVYFHLPAGMPVFFQALDEQAQALQTMRSIAYVQPGQTLSCVGCHESRHTAAAAPGMAAAIRREPSRLRPGPEGTWPLRFDRLVQPVLNRHCVGCHDPESEGEHIKARQFDLTAGKAWATLMQADDEDLTLLTAEVERSIPGQCPSQRSKLMKRLREGHNRVRLNDREAARLTTWMDMYAQVLGSYSAEQEDLLVDLRKRLAPILDETPAPDSRAVQEYRLQLLK